MNPVTPPTPDPEEACITKEYAVAAAHVPAQSPSGGDFHGTFPVNADSGDIAVVIGDISGHGPEQTVQAEHMRDLLSDCLAVGLSPAETLTAVNAMMEPNPHFDGFGTVFVGKIEADSGKLTYASGGHEPALLASPTEETIPVEELSVTGPPVGAFPSEMVHFEEQEATVPAGGTLLLYTDGVSEARAPEKRLDFFGVERLKKIVARFASLSPRHLVSSVLERVASFCRGRFQDDVAVVAVRRQSRAGKSRSKSKPRTLPLP